MRKHSREPQAGVGSLIGANTTIIGNIESAGGLRIDGRVKGNVVAAVAQGGLLVLGEQAKLEGSASAPHMVVSGEVVGVLIASGSLKLQAQARISGRLHYGSLEASRGAIVQGQLLPQAADTAAAGETALPQPALAG